MPFVAFSYVSVSDVLRWGDGTVLVRILKPNYTVPKISGEPLAHEDATVSEVRKSRQYGT